MRRMTILVVLACVLAACSSSGSDASKSATTTTLPRCSVTTDPGLARIDLKVGGKDRYALVHLPKNWDGKSPVPVVLSFHGLGSTADQQRTTDGFEARSDTDNFIVVYPQAGGTLGELGAAWDLKGTSELTYVTAVLDDLEQHACVDPSRVYATGLSYGGAMTDMLACNLSDRIAAAAPVSAYLPKTKCAPKRAVPMMSFHGVEDHLLPYAGGGRSGQVPFEQWGAEWAKRNGCAAKPNQSQYKPTVEKLKYSGCKQPVVLFRVHKNGHTWPGHPLGLPRQTMIDYFSGKTTGQPFPLMVALGLTPEDFADTISLANQDIDASAMILAFFRQHALAAAPKR
jgi:polyhydroxybutyrate depolymerase